MGGARPQTTVSWNYHDDLKALVAVGGRIAAALEELAAQGVSRANAQRVRLADNSSPAPFAAQVVQLVQRNAGFIDSQPAA